MEVTTKPFLVAAPTAAILGFWSLEGRKFGLAHLLNQIEFTTYRSLSKALDRGYYYKLLSSISALSRTRTSRV